MIITRLELRNFRSYPSLGLDFSEKDNVLIGKNGTGKTNLVEGIYLLSLCKSWRSNDIRTLIRQGEEAAFIRAYVREGEMSRKIEILITPKGKKISLNDKPVKRLSELSKLVNVTLFSPEDVNLFKDSPSSRRSFLDVSISKESVPYLSLIGRYGKILQERNVALKSPNPDKTYLEVLTNQLIDVSEPITRYRREYLTRLNEILSEVANALYENNRSLHLIYKPFVKENDFKETASKLYRKNLDNDLLHKTTTIGVHREDFSLLLDGNDIALYGSQGENRLAAIALKIAPYFLIQEQEKKPITILDDVYSELDDKHSLRLTKLLKNLGQVFVTTADYSIKGDALIDISKENATRRK